jgi:beta-carotene ketolase (CrtW type)
MRTTRTDSIIGIFVALIITGLWLVHLCIALRLNIYTAHPALLVGMFLLQTFLYTGLFITAHDAMHGSVCRHYRSLNNAIGRASVLLYALFSYKKLWVKHWEHHRHVATPHADPDFHDGEHTDFLPWYTHFLMNYIGWMQVVGMAVVFNVLHHLLHIRIENLLLFWVAPSLASTVQLFYFGTYLPHRAPLADNELAYNTHHRSNLNTWPVFWSFLSCYHFGYHYEHHDSPATPWWKLPELHSHYAHQSSECAEVGSMSNSSQKSP